MKLVFNELVVNVIKVYGQEEVLRARIAVTSSPCA